MSDNRTDPPAQSAAEQAGAASFAEAARWLVSVVGRIGPKQWDGPGLGQWNVRELAGHAARALVTTEEYLRPPALGPIATPPAAAGPSDPVAGAVAYFSRTLGQSELHGQIAERGRSAGAELGASPIDVVEALCTRVVALVTAAPGGSLFATRFGEVPFTTYLNTRIVEAVVHGVDLADACGFDADVPDVPGRLTLQVMVGVARRAGRGVELMRALGGRRPLPEGFNVFG